MRSHESEGWSSVFRLAKLAGVLMTAGLLVAVFYPKFNEFSELQERKASLQAELAYEQEALRALREKQVLMETKADFAERVAREEFGYAKPGEKVVRFTQQSAQPARTSAR